MKKLIQLTCILCIYGFSLFANEHDKRHILYLMHSNEIEKAFSLYQNTCSESFDLDILQKMCLILLKNGAKSSDAEIQKLSILGAGLCASNVSLEILETGLDSTDMDTQALSLHFISFFNDNKTDALLNKAMSSDFLPIRLEAAYHMSQRKHPNAIGQIESLMLRLPIFLKPFFPQFFAIIGTDDATKYLLKFLNDSNAIVRLETILSIANTKRDDLLPYIRKKIPNSTISEKEAICFTFARLKDSSGIKDLKILAKSNIDNVKIAAIRALYQLGDYSQKKEIEKLALENNLFAISILHEFADTEETLIKLIKSKNDLVRINAGIALLKKKNPKCLDILNEILISSTKDSALEPFFSIGRTMMYFKMVPLAVYRIKDIKNDPSLSIRESLLKETLEFNSDDFFKVIEMIFNASQKDLIPTAISLLENASSEKIIQFLTEKATNSNIPLIKDYANLSLYRLKQEGPYEQYISNWIKFANQENIIQLSLSTDKKSKKNTNIYSLTKEETSRLLLDMYSAIAASQNQKSLNLILDAIKKTNPKNRYALAGLLIRATH